MFYIEKVFYMLMFSREQHYTQKISLINFIGWGGNNYTENILLFLRAFSVVNFGRIESYTQKISLVNVFRAGAEIYTKELTC